MAASELPAGCIGPWCANDPNTVVPDLPPGYSQISLGSGWIGYCPNAPVMPTTLNCNGFAVILPMPSDPNYAVVLEAAIETVRQFGLALYGWADSTLLSLEEWIELHMPRIDRSCGWSDIEGCVKNALFLPLWAAAQMGTGAIELARKVICSLAKSTVTNAGCDPMTLFAISAAKSLWQILKKGTYGSNTWILTQFTLNVDINIIDKTLQYLESAMCPMGLPEIHHALHANLNDKIPDEAYTFIARTHGWHPKFAAAVRDASREQLRGWEPIEYIRRQSLGDTAKWNPNSPFVANEAQTEQQWQVDSRAALRGIGWIHTTDQDQFISVYDELPTIAQHLHWLARNVDNLSYVQKYHLLDGFSSASDVASILGPGTPPPLPEVGERNFWATFGPELRAQGMRKIDAAREYAAHWLHPAPQQMAQFVYRLRPDRLLKDWEALIISNLGYPAVAGGPPPPEFIFTTDDYRNLLSEQDYGYRDVSWFASTVYHIPALSYLRDMFRYGVISSEDLAGYHRDLGYSEQDSSRFVAVDAKIKSRIRTAEAHGWSPTALSNAYALGMITADRDRAEMTKLGFVKEEIDGHQDAASYQLRASMLRRAMSFSVSKLLNQLLSGYGEGVIPEADASAALGNLGVPAARAKSMLSTIDMQRSIGLVKQTKSALRRALLRGAITAADAKKMLSGFMPNAEVVQLTVDSWSVQMLANEKSATQSDIKRYLKEELITPDEASSRLTNLGMRSDSVQLVLDEHRFLMSQSEKKLRAKEQAEKDKAALKQQAEEKRAAQLAAKEQATKEASAAKATEGETARAAKAAQAAVDRAARAEAQQVRLLTAQQRQRQRELLTAAKEAEQMHARIIAALKKDEPVSKLAAWAKLGQIDKSYFAQRMSLYGYTQESIERSWNAACAAKTADCITDATGVAGVGTAADATAAANITIAATTAEWAGVTAAEAANSDNQGG